MFGRENVEQGTVKCSLSYVSEEENTATTLKDCSAKPLSGDSQILLRLRKAKGNFPRETEDKGEFLGCGSGLKVSGRGDWVRLGNTSSTSYVSLW